MVDIFKRKSLPIMVSILVLAIFSPVIYSHTYLRTLNWQTDFYQHMLYAIEIAQNGVSSSVPSYIVAHSGWQIFLAAGNLITGFTFQKVGFIVAVLCVEATALSLLTWYVPELTKNEYPAWKSGILIVGVMLASPVSILWFVDGLMYLGYIGITSHHNPTMYLLKPFSIIQFIYAYQFFLSPTPLKWRHIVLSALVSLIAAFVKPSLAICILPAIGILAAYRLYKKQYVNIYGVVFGIGIPTILMLAWQFLLTYYDNDAGHVLFAPFTVMGGYSKYLLLKFILSIPFPLLVLAIEYKKVTSDIRMVLGWVSFTIGALLSYLFMEGGRRAMDGNFGWSGEITLFLLFATSTIFVASLPKGRNKNILAGAWLLQVVSGVIYLIYCTTNMYYY